MNQPSTTPPSACYSREQVVDLFSKPQPTEQQRRMQAHIADCPVCQRTTHSAIAQFVSEADHKMHSRRLMNWLRELWAQSNVPRQLRWAAAAAVALLLLIGLLRGRLGPEPKTDLADAELLAYLAQASPPPIQLAYPGAQVRQDNRVARSGIISSNKHEFASNSGEIPSALYEKLQKNGNTHGLALIELMNRLGCSAAQRLAKTANRTKSMETDYLSAQFMCLYDRQRNAHPVHPLEWMTLRQKMTEQLQQDPNDVTLRWNRALVHDKLGLSFLAATDYGVVAAFPKGPMSDEAKKRQQEIESELKTTASKFAHLDSALSQMATQGVSLDAKALADVSNFSGMARSRLYGAARTAPTRERLLALRAVAEKLDAESKAEGSISVTAYLDKLGRQDFAVRGPLAAYYADVVAGRKKLDKPEQERFMQRLKDTGQLDILQGFVQLIGRVEAYPAVFADLLHADDPWFRLLAAERLATTAAFAGDTEKAEAIALPELQDCGTASNRQLRYRCAELRFKLSEIYLGQHRVVEADAHAQIGLQIALQLGDVDLIRRLLGKLGQISFYRHDEGATRAYLDEAIGRQPKECVPRINAQLDKAQLRLWALDAQGARRELDDIPPECTEVTSPLHVRILTDLVRAGAAPDRAKFRDKAMQEIADMQQGKARKPTVGEGLLLQHFAARLHSAFDEQAGESQMQQAIREAERFLLEHSSSRDADAMKAVAYGYSLLIASAARHHEWDKALSLFLTESGMSATSSCILGVSLEEGMLTVVGRNRHGAVLGIYDPAPKALVSATSSSQGWVPAGGTQAVGGELVPTQITQQMQSCEEIQVLARNALAGRPLLPPQVAHSIHLRRDAPTEEAALPARRLLVSSPVMPAGLLLPDLYSHVNPQPREHTPNHLFGRRATPSAVLSAMQTATEIEIHAHGLMSPDLSDAGLLVLSPELGDQGGAYALTAQQVRSRKLVGHPLVLLAACHLASSAPYQHTSWSLPMAFLEAGARAVVASPEQVLDGDAEAFFGELRTRLAAGTKPAVALRDARLFWLSSTGRNWPRDVLLFE